ncbi:MerR family transcriptional regulator [Culicoidibacter larvae]|uniref:MerR family transcriptional regulator n=1 Tax=Culicoidibacter larvae TaxID=2579976 RepID=A0A5R8Q871_9FIRM|nr:MerR family transcriptional regulator [Culicoidibacter larvae]TLG71777.1 MerR family transcriptional regulator [Culicoidibacter larvae]
MTISEVAKLYNISADTLRYYERIGLIPAIQKNSSGNRDYTEDDIYWVDFAVCMRSAGLPIEMLIEYLTLYKQGPDTAATRKQLLIEQRDILAENIAEMNATLERLNTKIANYGNITKKVNKLSVKN